MLVSFFFFFNDTATTEIYTLSLHDALPISRSGPGRCASPPRSEAPARSRRRRSPAASGPRGGGETERDRKSTRLNSSHGYISYAVFCLKKKKKEQERDTRTLHASQVIQLCI